MSKFFINRPIFAIVIAIITVILGLIMLATLPVAQFPKIAPPEIRLLATYVGADAQALEKAVATPIVNQISWIISVAHCFGCVVALAVANVLPLGIGDALEN